MRKLWMLATVMSLALVAACGGGSKTLIGNCTGGTGSTGSTGSTSCGTTGGGSTTGAVVNSLSVTTSSAQIAADGSTTATISAVAKDANNNFVQGATVKFSAPTGGLTVTQATTDASGLATATLVANGAAAGTAITVTATSGSASGNVTVNVVSIQQTISLTTDLPQIPSDGSKSATITALVRDANNNFVSGVAVSFNADSGGLTVTQGTTNASGIATATLSTANDPTNRIIHVTASAGSATQTLPIQVTGTTLTVTGPPNLVLNSSGTYTVALLNSSKTGIPNTTVNLASALGNTLSGATVTTDSTGQKTFTVTATKSGNDTITASALGLTAGQPVAVAAQSFAFTSPPANGATTQVNIGTAQPLTVQWTVNGQPQVGQTVNFAATRGTLSAASAVTDASGNATVSISSSISGPATVTASATGVTAQAVLDFIATTPASIDLQASPATIPTQGQSTLTAIVRDAAGNLVENATVNFKTVNDTTGGSLSVASAITDANGRAQTVYTASSTPSATNGVTIQASTTGAGGAAISQTANLTVGGITVYLSLGTGNTINENATKTQFIVPYTVIALDAGGNPVANSAITLTIHPLYYYKGGYYLQANPQQWVQTDTPASPPGGPPTACPNEDSDFTGIYDQAKDGFPAFSGQADYDPLGNQNGKLDPGGTAVASPASVTTGSDGSAAFNVIYPENEALWVKVQLIATTTVQGTESTASSTFVLPILATYLTTTTSQPPGFVSPYGTATVCTNPN